ncbi:MAG: glycosyltransferase family 2 protein [Candidatus Eremiobacteraeota bacterium]|nr:glycosyltransferase family 2 protein [Candidatus Eremiobacteraeota bacterium]
MSVIVPVYNEAASLAAHLRCLRTALEKRFGQAYELVVVDDGSSDATPSILRLEATRDARLRVLTHQRNLGIDAAIRTGTNSAGGDYVVTFDADLTYRPASIGALVDRLEFTGADIALASPFLRDGKCRNVPWLRWLFSVCANRFLSFAVHGHFRTFTCIVRAYRAQVIRRLLEGDPRLEVTFGILLAAYRAGYRIVEIPATLDWTQQPRARSRRTSYVRLARRTWEILAAGVRIRPATLLVVPGILPGLLPAVAAAAAFLRLTPTEIATATAYTFAIQCASLGFATFALASSARWNSSWKPLICSLSNSRTIKTIRDETSESPSAMLSSPYSLRER